MFVDQTLNSIQFHTSEPAALLQPHWIEPELCFIPISLVQREPEEIYAYQEKNQTNTRNEVQKSVRAVRQAIYHLHKNLANAVDADGNPHPVPREFAAHLQDTC